jgi:hypothetical protein
MMPSDYELITRDNIRRRGEEFDDIGRFIAVKLFSDRTHFVYELLQNAEDALERRFAKFPNSKFPCSVKFFLYDDRLEFRHYGLPFTEDDVRGISDILKSTKSGEINQIGKFGIGFKSVYAFTLEPEVHSGDEHFIVKNYIRPCKATKIPKMKDDETVFIFPFEHDGISSKESFELIEGKLQSLGPRVLLFLHRIDGIEWIVNGKPQGMYLRESKTRNKARYITVIGQKNGKEEEEEWLIFSQNLKHKEKRGDIKIEISFRAEQNQKTGKKEIVKTLDSSLFVYFPTDMKTRMGFLMQGPYDRTPAGDNIMKNAWNTWLIEKTSLLLIESLKTLRKDGLLTISALECLPIREEDFPEGSHFKPVEKAVKEAMLNEVFLPARDGTYISAAEAKLARGAGLRKLLSSAQLSSLCGTEQQLKWITEEITQDRTPELRIFLMKQLGVEEIDPDSFANKITESFLLEQPDEWIINFYIFLSDQEALWGYRKSQWNWSSTSPGPLRNKAIIRCQDNNHVVPFRLDGRPNVYFCPEEQIKLNVVKKCIAENKEAKAFLLKLGITEIGERERIEVILNKYYKEGVSYPSDELHLKHIKEIIKWLFSNLNIYENIEMLKSFCIFHDENSVFRNPNAFYIDFPFKQTGLSILFKGEHQPRRFPLWQGYHGIENFEIFASSLGVQDNLISEKCSTSNNPNSKELRKDAGAPWSNHKIDEDYTIRDIDKILAMQNVMISQLLWNFMTRQESKILTAQFRPNKSYSFRTAPSTLVCKLREAYWVPAKDDKFYSPRELSQSMLHDMCPYDNKNGWLSAIEFGKASEEAVNAGRIKKANEIGISKEHLELLDIIKDIKEVNHLKVKEMLLGLKQPQNSLISQPVVDPGKRISSAQKKYQEAPKRTYKRTSRSVRISQDQIDKRTHLREWYSVNGRIMCQICRSLSSFKNRQDKYYFEAVEFVADEKEYGANALALCPSCAAKYLYGKRTDNDVIKGELKKVLDAWIHGGQLEGKDMVIKFELCDKPAEIYFVEKHLCDLSPIIEEA